MEISEAPVIPGHQTVRELGRGAHASVWLATSHATGRQAAVKCLAAADSAAVEARAAVDGGSLAGLQREVRILSRLQHEHLVRVHDVVRLGGAFDGRPGVVMDYAAGGSLGRLLGVRGQLSAGETVTIVTPLARALAYLHQEGVVHADVSPGNVLFTAHGKPLLADLGMARMLGDTGNAPDQGTPGFTDPAQAGDRGILRPERDCFSLAALAWFCLTGAPPGPASTRPPLTLVLPEVPVALAAAIESGLQENPGARPTAMAFGSAVYRSAAAAPVDLSDAVDSTVVPELLTRRRPAPGAGHGRRLLGKTKARGTAKEPGFVRAGTKARKDTGTRAGSRTAGSRPSAAHRKRIVPAALSAAAVLLLVAGGIWWSSAAPRPASVVAGPAAAATNSPSVPPAPSTASAAPAPDRGGVDETIRAQLRSTQPEEAVKGLSALRDAALRTGRMELLTEVNVAGSAAAVADAKIKAEMEKSGIVLAGFTTVLTDIRLSAPPGDGQTAVTAVVGTSAFEERDAAGKLVRTRAAGAPQQLRLLLNKVDGGWRIADILAGNT